MKFNIHTEIPETEGNVTDPGFILEVETIAALRHYIDFEGEFLREDGSPLSVHSKLIIERVE